MILAIDPGPEKSGWVLYENRKIEDCGIYDNEVLIGLEWLFDYTTECTIEMVASYGMPVGKSIFETCVWIGRFKQMAIDRGVEVTECYRKDVKMHLCGSMRAKDANIRQALIDKFPATGGGKVPQIGIKSKPGPLYGVKGDIWAALALAVTYEETVLKDKIL